MIMPVLRTFQDAFKSLVQQGTRTFLAGVGVTVGTIAILLLIGIAKGVQEDVSAEVKDIGVNVLIVVPGRVSEDAGSFNLNLGGHSFLTQEHIEDVRKVPGVVRASPLTFAGGGAKANGKEAYPITIAAEPQWFSIHKTNLQEGRTYNDSESNKNVCVLGSIAKDALFGKEASALGKKITVNSVEYEVVGVEKSKEESSLLSGFSLQNVIYLPYQVVKSQRPDMQIDRIMIQTAPEVEPKGLKQRIDDVLGEKLDRQQYSVLTQDDLLGLVFKIMNILTWLVTGLTSIAVFVGGIGITNSMLMSVNERTKEIGIRKSVGANNFQIFRHFLAESILITVTGSFVGLLFSLAVGKLLATYTPIKPIFSPETLAITAFVSVILGSLFGVIPASKAARKDPIAALRLE